MTKNETAYEYRADGWPLCPGCGEDELADLSVAEWPQSFKADPTAELRCYLCGWVGEVPAASPIRVTGDAHE